MESIVKVARGWAESRMRTYCLMDTGFPFEMIRWIMKMKINSGNDYTTS